MPVAKKARPRKKREAKHVSQGIAHIHSSFNNTIVSISDTTGGAIAWASAGGMGVGVWDRAGKLLWTRDDWKTNRSYARFNETASIQPEAPPLAALDSRTLVVAGRHDWICPPDLSELIASKIPKADLRIFENSSHSVAADGHDALMDVIRGFVPYNRG